MTQDRTMDHMVQKKRKYLNASTGMFYTTVLLAISLPLSEFGMSVSQFILFGFWIFEGADYTKRTETHKNLLKILAQNVAGKFRRLFSNYILLIFTAIFFYHVIGLLYSSDVDYALNDIRVKLPILTLPILLGTSGALNFKRFNLLILFFTISVIIGSLISIYVYYTRTISDPREISIFISHIRFSLFIVLAIFILGGLIAFNSFKSKLLSLVFGVSLIWLTVFLFILKSFTGIIIGPLILFGITVIIVFRNRNFRILTVAILGILIYLGIQYLIDIQQDFKVSEPIDYSITETSQGNQYYHDTLNFGVEYGKYVGSYLAINELRDSWNRRSGIKFDSLDLKGQELKYTLIRYLHSKGLRKDAQAVNSLTDYEIAQIENGLANYHYTNGISLRGYIEQIYMGYYSYKHDNNPNASSVMQRIEYWKTAIHIIEKSILFGQGTGDVSIAFSKAYQENSTALLPEYQHRTHNQFLTIFIALGALGLIVFLVSLLYPPIKLGKFRNYYYLVFFLIVVLSFLTEDTLETQPGSTFFAFFSAVMLFGIKKEVDEKSSLIGKSNKVFRFAKQD